MFGSPKVVLTYSAPGNFVQNVGALSDFNGDGHVDYLAVYSSFGADWRVADVDSPLRLFIGDGKGGFKLGTSGVINGPVPGTTAPTETVLADFNGDGHLDVFIPDQGYDDLPFPGHLNVLLLSDQTGRYLVPKGIPGAPSDFSSGAWVGDIEGDGDVDIFVCNYGGSGIQIAPYFLLNDGAGNFTIDYARVPAPQNGSTDFRYTASLMHDVDLDGDPELILGTSDGMRNQSVVLRNDGNGNFSGAVNLPTAPVFGTSTDPDGRNGSAIDIDVADINADGRLDILVTYTSHYALGGYLQINTQNADGSFTNSTATLLPQSTDSASSALWDTIVVDMDDDGDLDIVAFYQDHISLFTNDGQGRFSLSDTLDNWTRSCSIADVNGDTLPDIVWAEPIHGGNDEDVVLVSLNMYRSGKDNLKGSSGDDTLKGFGNDDSLSGGAGADWLCGGFGADRQKGGKGADVFVFKSLADSTVKAAGRDLVLDFKRGDGDRLDLSAIVATAEIDTIEFIGKKKFSGDAPEIRFEKSNSKTVVFVDVDGNGKPDFAIALAKAITMKEGDFLI